MLDSFLNFFRSFDEEGYDRKGFNRQGFNRDGIHRNGTAFDRTGYDVAGFDRDGFSWEGFDREGFGRDGFNRGGYDRDGYDRSGYNLEGFDRKGFDREGYARDGYDAFGYARDGYDRDGYDRDGCDRDGYNHDGYDRDGYDRDGFSISGHVRGGKIWWLSGTTGIPDRFYAQETPVSEHRFEKDPIGANPIGTLGFTTCPQAKEALKRAREITRLAQAGITPDFDDGVPYCAISSDPLMLKEAAEILGSPKKVNWWKFFWLDFDRSKNFEATIAALVGSKQLHAAYHGMRHHSMNMRGKRLRFLIALLIFMHEGTEDASEALGQSWQLLGNGKEAGSFELDIEEIGEFVADLAAEVSEHYGRWELAAQFGEASGKYAQRYLDACVAPKIEDVKARVSDIAKRIKTLEDSVGNGSAPRQALKDLRTSINSAKRLIDSLEKDAGIPKGYAPRSELMNEFAQQVRNAAVAVVSTSEDLNETTIDLVRKMLKMASRCARGVTLQHRIQNDEADLDCLVEETRYVKKRDELIERSVKCFEHDDYEGALSYSRKALDIVRSPQEVAQIRQFINTVRKAVLVQTFGKQMNSGQFQAALSTINEAISLEEDWSARMELCKVRDELSAQIELYTALRNRRGW